MTSSNERTSSLLTAFMANDVELIEKLLDEGKDPCGERDTMGRTVMHLAATRGQHSVLEILVLAGTEVNVTDFQGNTPLHYCGHRETIQCLVEAGAQLQAQNRHGDTPLVLMQRRGVETNAVELLEKLIREGADRRLSPEDDSEPLLPQRWSRPRRPERGIAVVRSVWLEFCADLGPEKLLAVILFLLVLSLYVAYIVTGYAKQIDTRIPVDAREL